jgi:2-phospho-L-lactate/phosphoenolpyruvate guanylyltransferase
MIETPTETSGRRVWATVPFRGPTGSKRRLAGLLEPAEREQLSMTMLNGVLNVLLADLRIERVVLLTSSPASYARPEHPRLAIVEEPRFESGPSNVDGLNLALEHAQHVATAGGADGLLILPADLPLIECADLDAVLAAWTAASVVVAPDRAAEGTNALLLSPPNAFSPGFGPDSFARHLQLADQIGLHSAIVERAGLGLDLDTPDDVAALFSTQRAGPVVSLLRQLGVDRRLGDPEPAQARSTTI